MHSFAIFSLIASSAFACAPTGTPGTGATSTSATFTMSINPPAKWSYPLTAAAISPPQRAATKEKAQAQIEQDILQEINVILIDNKYPVDAIKLTVDPVDIKGNILTLAVATPVQCGTDNGLVLTGDTITGQCTKALAGDVEAFPAVKITGTFDAKASGILVTEAMWKGLGVKLQKALEGDDAQFTEQLAITPVKA